MFVKMLTHLHMVMYTWWCWHIRKLGGIQRFWENEVRILYWIGGKFGEVAGVFLAEKPSSNAGVGSTWRWTRASGALSAAGAGIECAPDAGTGRGQDTVHASNGAWRQWVFVAEEHRWKPKFGFGN